MFARCVIVLSLFWISAFAQQFPYQPDENPRGVCTINGKVYYGIDCWCYSSSVGATLVTISFVTLFIFFLISGCIWACIFTCCKCMINRKDDDRDIDLGSFRSSMRSRASMRKRDPDTPIQITHRFYQNHSNDSYDVVTLTLASQQFILGYM